MLKVVESKLNFDVLFEWAVLSISIISIFIGLGGLIIVMTIHQYKTDPLIEYAYTFVYSYMLVLGILLMIYRKKIIVKKR